MKQFIDYSKVPDELKQLHSWGITKLEERNKTLNKVPYSALTGYRASSTSPKTWATFDQAYSRLRTFKGSLCLAFFLKAPYMCIDIDKIKSSNDQRLKDFINIAGKSYVERSQSGNGVHFIIKSNLNLNYNKANGVEIYNGKRFIALTGDSLNKFVPNVLEVSNEYLEPLYKKYLVPKKPIYTHYKGLLKKPNLNDDQILELMLHREKTSERWRNIYNGRYGQYFVKATGEPDGSRADIALLGHIYFYSGNAEQTLRIFETSELATRDKWQHYKNYHIRTLNKVMSNANSFYSGRG